jgi:putative toxin-antitoxin system antitoxin component (TIGR02293 family)
MEYWQMHRRTIKARPAPAARLRNQARPSDRNADLGIEFGNTAGLVRQIQAGLPYATLNKFRRAYGLPMDAVAALVQIPQRTLNRRRAEGRLRPDESDRLVRVSRVFNKAAQLFEGNGDAAIRWLSTAQPALGQQVPLDFMQTEVGSREVEDLIGRLEHGVFT